MSQSETAIPLCQTLHWVFHKDRCWAQYSLFCISMTYIDPQIRCVLFILLMIQEFLHLSDINNVYATVNRDLVGVDNWLKANRLSLNISKSSYMIISYQKMQLRLEFEIQFLQKFQLSNSLALHLMKTLHLMTL